MERWKELTTATLGLFLSGGTLVCCALPALLVSLGFGAVMAGLVSAVPQLVWLSEHKAWVFGASGAMLVLAMWVQHRQRFSPCPADPKKAAACGRLRRLSWWVTGVSVAMWGVGFFFAFVAPKLLIFG